MPHYLIYSVITLIVGLALVREVCNGLTRIEKRIKENHQATQQELENLEQKINFLFIELEDFKHEFKIVFHPYDDSRS